MRHAPRPARSIKDLVAERRAALAAAGLSPAQGKAWWGLALSGGGIRSATFALGLTRALARHGLLLRFDLLSTVSGGGYLGAMLGRLFDRAADGHEARAVEQGFGAADERWCHWWLRNASRYLTPDGLRDLAEIAAMFLRNLVALHLEFAQPALALGFAMLAFNVIGWQLGAGLGLFSPYWWWAQWALVPLALLLLAAFWRSAPARGERRAGGSQLPVIGLWMVAVGLLVLTARGLDGVAVSRLQERALQWWPWVLLLGLLGLLGAWLSRQRLRRLLKRAASRLPGPRSLMNLRDSLRQSLGRALGWVLAAAAVLLVLGLLDRAAWWLAFDDTELGGWLGGGALALAGIRFLGPRLASLGPHLPRLLQLPALLLLELAGWLLLGGLGLMWVAVAYRAGVLADAQGQVLPSTLWVCCAALLALALLRFGTERRRDFVNLSSLHGFYRGRLTRAFLGAANAARFGSSPLEPVRARRTPQRLGDPHGDDDCPLGDYAPQRGGGPVHLINVCANETQDLRGGLSNPDRRGRLLTLAPGGLARLGLDHWTRLAPAQALSLGSWVAVSGAALGSGLGARTAPGRAALLTLLGLRLGLWWNPGALLPAIPRWWRRLSPAARAAQPRTARQANSRVRLLWSELSGGFTLARGPWFLSDGGHAENTGAYALLAQRCRLVVLADAAADPTYRFADLENLVRKARIDLGAEIRFQRPNAVGRRHLPPQLGSMEELCAPDSQACLALARIAYRGGSRGSGGDGLLLLVKPNVFAGLPLDLQHFKREQPLFPQQGTGDQSFSEAQWESYRRLGEELGELIARHRLLERPMDSWLPLLEDDDGGSALRVHGEAPRGSGVAATLVGGKAAAAGAGALATLGLSGWALMDLLRPPQAPPLAPLLSAYGKLDASGKEAPALAAQWLQLADSLCTSDPGAAAALRRSALAQCLLADVKSQCRSSSAPACQQLTLHTQCLDDAAWRALRQRGQPTPPRHPSAPPPAAPVCAPLNPGG